MRISDWSSDVCSSDLQRAIDIGHRHQFGSIVGLDRTTIEDAETGALVEARQQVPADFGMHLGDLRRGRRAAGADCPDRLVGEIGRATCRERVCQYVEISGVSVSLKKKKTNTY